MLSTAVRVTLAGMPAYLRCKLTGDGVSPYYLNNTDAEDARGSSELLVVDSWTGAGQPWFPRQHGIRSGPVIDGQWRSYNGLKVERLIREFLAQI